MMADLISRAAAIDEVEQWAEHGYDVIHWTGIKAMLEIQPTIAAIPVEWLEAQIRPYTGDVSDIGKSAANGTIKGIIRKWQKEQEAQDAGPKTT